MSIQMPTALQRYNHFLKAMKKSTGQEKRWSDIEIDLVNCFVITEGVQFHNNRKKNGYFSKMAQLVGTRDRRQCTKKFYLLFKPGSSTQPLSTEEYVRSLIFENDDFFQEKMDRLLDCCREALSTRIPEEKVDQKMRTIKKYVEKIRDKFSRESSLPHPEIKPEPISIPPSKLITPSLPISKSELQIINSTNNTSTNYLCRSPLHHYSYYQEPDNPFLSDYS